MSSTTTLQFRWSLATAMFAVLVCGTAPALAQTPPALGKAKRFAVLAGSTVTNTGPSFAWGDLGVSPGTSITGFPPGVVAGTIGAATAFAALAQTDLTTAYNSAAGATCTTVLTGMDLGGRTLTPGVYCFTGGAGLTGALTLDALGNPNAVFIFQIGSTLVTAANSSVRMINGGEACNVFWQVGSSATLGSSTVFVGNILAQVSITLNTGTSVAGRALARTGAVTMANNRVAVCCAPATSTPLGAGCPSAAGPSPVLTTNMPVLGQNFVININSPGTPGSLAIVTFGLSRTSDPSLGALPRDLSSLGAPGCTFYCSCVVVCHIWLNAAGLGQATLPLPNDPKYCGFPICNQALVLDPTANALGAVVSSAVFNQVGS